MVRSNDLEGFDFENMSISSDDNISIDLGIAIRGACNVAAILDILVDLKKISNDWEYLYLQI